jgi:hypothetical protein
MKRRDERDGDLHGESRRTSAATPATRTAEPLLDKARIGREAERQSSDTTGVGPFLGPYLDLMPPAPADRSGTVRFVKSAI